MKSLKALRDKLLEAEEKYKKAHGSLDGGIELIIAREELNQCRFSYSQACQKVMNKLLDDEFLSLWIERRMEDKLGENV